MKKIVRRPTENKFREFQSLGYTACRIFSFQAMGLFKVSQSSGTEDSETAILLIARPQISALHATRTIS
jgi:hypothetical protein